MEKYNARFLNNLFPGEIQKFLRNLLPACQNCPIASEENCKHCPIAKLQKDGTETMLLKREQIIEQMKEEQENDN